MRNGLAYVVLAAAGLSLSGCCSLARGFCPVAPAETQFQRFTRDTPDSTIDFLVDAFEGRRIADIYNSLDPLFRADYGGFTLAEFTSAFEEYEDLFRQDAAAFSRANRENLGTSADGQYEIIRLVAPTMSVELVFSRRAATEIRLDDDFVPVSRGTVADLGSAFEMKDGWVWLKEPVYFEGLQGASPATVTRFEIHRDWRIRGMQNARGVKFLERIQARF